MMQNQMITRDWVFKARTVEQLLEKLNRIKTIDDLRLYYRSTKIQLDPAAKELLHNDEGHG